MDKRIRFEYVKCRQGNFVFGKKKLRIKKYLGTRGRGLNIRLGGYLERVNKAFFFKKKNDKFQRNKSSWN